MSKNSLKTFDKEYLISKKIEEKENSISLNSNLNLKTKITKKLEKAEKTEKTEKDFNFSQSQGGKNFNIKNSLKKSGDFNVKIFLYKIK
jgi:hypothetical protein